MSSSNYYKDLSNESLLGVYLNKVYPKIFEATKYVIKRIDNLDLQHKGVDLVLTNKNITYYVDEKAQLDYLNKSLPTFAFELSYLKNDNLHKGWLYDGHKLTNIYFLITNIYTKNGKDLSDGIRKVKITGVYRDKLIQVLNDLGLSAPKLSEIDKKIRLKSEHGKIPIKELNPKTEGYIYYSKDNKAESPINLVLKLKFLEKTKISSVLFNS
ncbi:hypothetical protein [uncultured Algibacter sp.]|uniref:hypothetical protein n=1 Tax=uncultured Algibacter sp. TaxID=298659 RepID=UPI00260CC681|nr:hypothetical protein [uncultured Algibacter sp.]